MRDVRAPRLTAQHLANPRLNAVDLVTRLGAIQAQEYSGALWAVGLRTRGETLASIERALADGEILRTHPMRGTHHFVARSDIRWLIELMGPLMIRRNERRNRELDLDEKTLAKAMRVLAKALEGGNHLTRAGVTDVLQRAKISPEGQRLAHIIYRAELEGLVCSGKRAGKQITIALLSERAPNAKSRSREDSLRELATRYFTTRGPATAKDFTWWCQLPAADVREAMALAKLETDGNYFWRDAQKPAPIPRALLIPPYDEYTVAYVDRSAAGTPPPDKKGFGESTLLGPGIVVDGEIVGSWKKGRKGEVIPALWRKVAKKPIDEAIARYEAFSRQPPPSAR
jgi:hypothetical protein